MPSCGLVIWLLCVPLEAAVGFVESGCVGIVGVGMGGGDSLRLGGGDGVLVARLAARKASALS